MPSLNKLVYTLAYRMGKPRWDSGAVPPQVSGLVQANHSHTALDLGCGTGTCAIYFAQHGLNVVGVDLTRRAVETARAKATIANVKVDFRVGDVTRLDLLGLHKPFDIVLDMGCFHGLDKTGRQQYAKHLAHLTHPGGTFLLWGFDGPMHFGRYGLSPDQVRQAFAQHFQITQTRPGSIQGGSTGGVWYWLTRQNVG